MVAIKRSDVEQWGIPGCAALLPPPHHHRYHRVRPAFLRSHPVLERRSAPPRPRPPWALPSPARSWPRLPRRSGMVDDNEQVSAAVRREFTEEAGNIADPEERAQFTAMCDELFAKGEVVYQGYVDEPRNTDHSWIETSVFHMHCSPARVKVVVLAATERATRGSSLPPACAQRPSWL